MLALALGCTVGELQQRMGAAEFASWLAFYQMEPFGELRADMRAAMLASLTANAHRNTKKRAKPFELGDFLFAFWQRGEGRGARGDAPTVLAKFRALTSELEHRVADGD